MTSFSNRPLSGESHWETMAVLPGPSQGNEAKSSSFPVPSKETLGQIKLAPASCHLQPIKATYSLPRGRGTASLKNLIVSQGYGYFFRFFSLKKKKKNSPWLELNFFL